MRLNYKLFYVEGIHLIFFRSYIRQTNRCNSFRESRIASAVEYWSNRINCLGVIGFNFNQVKIFSSRFHQFTRSHAGIKKQLYYNAN